MPRNDNATPSHLPREQALEWFSREQLGTLSVQEKQERDAWLASNPAHEREYRSLQQVWQVADHLPMDEMREIMTRPAQETPRFTRRRWLIGTGATVATVAAGAWISRPMWAETPVFTQRLLTARGGRQQFDLPDGSRLDLNTDTELNIAFYESRRSVELLRGEALFAVHSDKSRPFSVEAGEAHVLVTGTQFNVRREADKVTVAVREGSVQLSTGPWWRRERASLTAGQVSSAVQSSLTPLSQERVEAITAWQQGRIVFRDVPLATVASELSRYLDQPLRVLDPQIAKLRISGTLSIEEPAAALDILPDIAPVLVARQADGSALLMAR
ncbi:FecR family protein [Alcaligenes parafaecalis]|uniref:FecR domain-containing protein n=1 Tax=Alcaligenes parafaecalis TaxID=171260 RepID=A0ABT3VKZ2_9BURK|nr:FecR domain-containing protein [Alcaligenes parafaecalis]MCX5464179.1 FecR domain-containing protein [Alcaligenes parafaecalis]